MGIFTLPVIRRTTDSLSSIYNYILRGCLFGKFKFRYEAKETNKVAKVDKAIGYQAGSTTLFVLKERIELRR